MRRSPSDSLVTRDVLPLFMRTALRAASLNDDARTVEVTFTTGARVLRRDWWNDSTYYEELSLSPSHVRMARLNNGAPVLDTHSGYSLRSQIGVVEAGSAKLSGSEGIATLRMSKRADVEPIWQDIRDGIVQNVSVGYRIYALEKTQEMVGKVPVMRAVDWEPYEISFVPAGADDGAGTRSTSLAPNRCVLLDAARAITDQDRARSLRLALARAR